MGKGAREISWPRTSRAGPTVTAVSERDGDVRRIDPPRRVLVRHDDGRWYTGWQDGWVRWPGGWRASVRYSTAPGEQYVRSLPAERVTLAE